MSRDDDDKERAEDDDRAKVRDSAAQGEREESTRGIAEALGVDDEPAADPTEEGAADDGAPTEAAAAAAAVNRASRRRGQALERRQKKSGVAAAPVEEEDSDVASAIAGSRERDLPRDRNARAKELLKRRQQAASTVRRGGPSGLDTGEMVQDALARGSSAAGRFFRENLRFIVGGAAILALGIGGFMFFRSREEAKAGSATGALSEAIAADRGRVIKEDKRPDEEKQADPTRVFSTSDARAQAAIEGYQKALTSTGEAGPTTLARLGLAGAQLEKGDAQAAIDTYAAVLATPLANADLDVKGRSIEGTGLAQELKGDLDGALRSFDELAKVEAKGFEELGLYHQARIHTQKGDNEKAKELLKKARTQLTKPGEAGQAFPFLEAVVDGALRSLDPTAAPARVQLGGAKGDTMSPDELNRLQEQLRKAMEQKGDGHEGEGAPGMPGQEEPQ